MKKTYIGCSGFSNKNCVDEFYPADLSTKDELLQDEKNKEMFAKLEKRLQEQEEEQAIEKEVSRIISQWNI